MNALRNSPQVIVATPGRLLDFCNQGVVSLSNIHFLVLDEADRMLEMGFADQLKEILALCPAAEKRQTTMWTATWPKEVEVLLQEHFPTRFTKISMGTGLLQANPNITQNIVVTQPQGRLLNLLGLLEKHTKDKILIFTNTKVTAIFLDQELKRKKNWTSFFITWRQNTDTTKCRFRRF